MATLTRGSGRPRSPLSDQQPATDAEIIAAVSKSKDLELITGDELLEAIDAHQVCGLIGEHDLDLIRWNLTEGGDA